MTKDQAHAECNTEHSYVEYYAGEFIVVPYAPVVQPQFFSISPVRK